MKVGIYISGLGQSQDPVPAESYANNLIHELKQSTQGIDYDAKTEKVKYAKDRECNVVNLVEYKEDKENIIYRFYEFRYSDTLTRDFTEKNILMKSFMLFWVVVGKFPLLLKRIFVSNGYNKPFLIFYLFGLFFIIGFAILFMIPACITLVTEVVNTEGIESFIKTHLGWTIDLFHWLGFTKDGVKLFSNNLVSFVAFIMLIVPRAKGIITMLATEFVCAHQYLQRGIHRQEIFKELDDIMEYIAENEENPEVYFHTYSFGSIVAIDYLFPYGNIPSDNVTRLTKALITTGSPFDFIKAYYPSFFRDRNHEMETKISWLNVYSAGDALGSNFRKDTKIAESQYGLTAEGLKPVNMNYEVSKKRIFNIMNIFGLDAVKAHAVYWIPEARGQSCLRLIYKEMVKQKLI
jgi:hypothetical protein